jgi:hypothetical protein
LIILKLFKPEYLNISNSFLSIRLIKKICVDNKKIKGSISKITEGAFNNDRKTIYKKFISIDLKKLISSKIPLIDITKKKIIKIFKNEILKRLIINFI